MFTTNFTTTEMHVYVHVRGQKYLVLIFLDVYISSNALESNQRKFERRAILIKGLTLFKNLFGKRYYQLFQRKWYSN